MSSRFSLKRLLLAAALILAVVLIRLQQPSAPSSQTPSQAPRHASPSPRSAFDAAPPAAVASAAAATIAQPAHPSQSPPSDVFPRFATWLTAHRRGENPPLATGLALAHERRATLKTLIATDPRAALAHAVARTTRATLPAEILAVLETPIDATGRFEVLTSCNGPRAEVTRFAVIGEQRFTAHTHGRRLVTSTKHRLPLHGIAIDDLLALAEEPFRRLEPAELPATSPAAAVAVAIGDEIHAFDSETTLADWHRTAALAESRPDPTASSLSASPLTAAAPPDWTVGEKSVLWIRAQFADDTALVTTDAAITSAMSSVNDFFRDLSRGRTSFRTTILPGAARLSRDRAYYNSGTGRIADLESEALRLAREYDAANGNTGAFNPDRHDRWIVVFKHLNVYWWAGTAFVGDKGIRLNENMQPAVIAHELGHNHGVHHSHAWRPYEGSTVGNGEHVEYGDPFDIMGGGNVIPDGHFNTTHKQALSFLADSEATTVTASGTYRLYRHDHRSAGGVQVLKIPAGRFEYSVEHRRTAPRNNFPHGPRLESGVLLRWSKYPTTYTGPGVYLLDATPNSASGLDDAILGLDETFTDARRGIHITPVATGGDSPREWVDVRVSFGATGSNRNPTVAASAPAPVVPARTDLVLHANATDPDNDPVSFVWEIGEEEILTTSPTLNYRWIAGGNYTVKCAALDGRGGYAAQTFNITVEDPLVNWTRRGQGVVSGAFYAATHARNQFVVIGTGAATSPDGITWTRGSVPSGHLYRDITYSDSAYVAVGYKGPWPNSTAAIGYSTDGRAWQDVSPDLPAPIDLQGVAYGAGRFVAVGNDGLLLHSADGRSWTRTNTENTRSLRAVRFATGRFLAAGEAGTVLMSTDGLTWQNRSVESAVSFYTIAYHRGQWVLGGSGEAWYSTDQTATWVKSYPPSRPLFHELLSTTGSELLLMSHVASDELYVSETGHRWTTVPVATPKVPNFQWGLAEAGGTIVIAGYDGRIMQTSIRHNVVNPAISSPPRAQTIATGQTTTLSVTASGGALSYQWNKDGRPIPGATGVSLVIPNATAADAGSYSVTITNLVASITSEPVTLTVDARTVHVVQMAASRSASAGSQVALTVVPGGKAPFTYQWKKDGADLPGATDATLTLDTVLPEDAGNYTVVVSDPSGNITSSPTTLTVTGEVPFVVSTLAGMLRTAGSADGTGTDARFGNIADITVDAAGYLYVTDRAAHAIRRVSPSGTVVTLAGRGAGFNDGPAANALFNLPTGIVRDRAGNIFIADTNNNRIRRLTPAGVVSTFVGQAQGTVDGPAASARLWLPGGLAIDTEDNLYFTEGITHLIRKVTPQGVVSTLAGSIRNSGHADGRGDQARFNFSAAAGLTFGPDGNLYVADPGNHVIRVITLDGVVTTLAGRPGLLGSTDGLLANARFTTPRAVAFDRRGNLYVSSFNAIRVITPAGLVSTPLGSGAASSSFNDGPGTAARFSTVTGLSTDPLGNLYIADSSNVLVRKASPVGRRGARLANLSVRTLAGTGNDTLIVGFALADGSKPLLVRAVGPTLGTFGVGGALANPTLQLDANGATLAQNDDWHAPSTQATAVAAAAASVGAFALPEQSRDSALLQTLTSGSYTAQVGGGNGVALVELYDASTSAPRLLGSSTAVPRLANVSARTRAGSGNDALIVGFVVTGDSARTILLRAIGPTLDSFGVSGALANPRLELIRDSLSVATNTGWGGATALANAFAQVGAFTLPADSRDAALLVTLLPGAYTAQVTPAAGAAGVVLVEIYDVP